MQHHRAMHRVPSEADIADRAAVQRGHPDVVPCHEVAGEPDGNLGLSIGFAQPRHGGGAGGEVEVGEVRRNRRHPPPHRHAVGHQKMPGLLSASVPAGSATFSALSSPAFSFGRFCTTSMKRLVSRAVSRPSVMVRNLRM